MHTKILEIPGKFVWIDIVQPERQELEEIARQYGLHATSLADCLDPFHLPKRWEKVLSRLKFLIVTPPIQEIWKCSTNTEVQRKKKNG